LATETKTPEERRDRQINLAVVNYGLGHNCAAEAEDFVDLLDTVGWVSLQTEWMREE